MLSLVFAFFSHLFSSPYALLSKRSTYLRQVTQAHPSSTWANQLPVRNYFPALLLGQPEFTAFIDP